MINREWVEHRSGMHHMFPSSADIKDSDGNALVTTYAVHRPDGNWSLMLVNRDENNMHTIRVVFNEGNRGVSFEGPVRVATFGSEQYVWINDGPNSHADPDGPVIAGTLVANWQSTFSLPKASITVLRGKVPSLN
jgi:hypothetical protein